MTRFITTLLLLVNIGLTECAQREITQESTPNVPVATVPVTIKISTAVEYADMGLTQQQYESLTIDERMKQTRKVVKFSEEAQIAKRPEPESTDWQKADELYKQFVKANAAKPALRYFKDRFAQIILIEYHLMESERYDKIREYTQILIDCQSEAVLTIAHSLSRLKGRVPAKEYKALIKQSLQTVDMQIVRQQPKAAARQATENNQKQALSASIINQASRQQIEGRRMLSALL